MSNFGSSRLSSQIVKGFLMLAIAILTFSITSNLGSTGSRAIANSVADLAPNPLSLVPRSGRTDSPLTPPRVHPLPPSLVLFDTLQSSMQSSMQNNHGSDYFAEIKPTPLGYLVWSRFPVRLYVDQPLEDTSISEQERFTSWTRSVTQALEEWQQYLPLEIVTQAESADIEVLRSFPPQRATHNPNTGVLEIPRAAAAQTRYQFYLQNPERLLAHRFTIYLSPSQTAEYTLATARHELGHALGIWGHSPLENDVMYFSQVRNPPPISPRDINTLRRIYQQPTQLGWRVEGD